MELPAFKPLAGLTCVAARSAGLVAPELNCDKFGENGDEAAAGIGCETLICVSTAAGCCLCADWGLDARLPALALPDVLADKAALADCCAAS
jgi:hypothetical protein